MKMISALKRSNAQRRMTGTRTPGALQVLPQIPQLAPLDMSDLRPGDGRWLLEDNGSIQQTPNTLKPSSDWDEHSRESPESSIEYFPNFESQLQDILPQGMLLEEQSGPKCEGQEAGSIQDDSESPQEEFPPPPASEVEKYARKPLPARPSARKPSSDSETLIEYRMAKVAKKVQAVPRYQPDVYLHWEGMKSRAASVHVVGREDDELPVAINQTEPVPMTWYGRTRRRATFDQMGLLEYRRDSTADGR